MRLKPAERTVIFCAYDRPGYLAGGPNTWLRRLLPELRSRGWNVVTLVIHTGNVEECPLVQWLLQVGLAVQPLSRADAPFVHQQVGWLLGETKRIRPAVFVANLVTPAFYAVRWIKKAGIPCVGVFHADEPFCEAMADNFVNGPEANSFHAAVCVSRTIQGAVSSRNPHAVVVERIPCGAPVPDRLIERPDGPLRVLYVGRIAQKAKRALDVGRAFCAAALELPETTYSMVGSGPEEVALIAIIDSCPSRSRVKFEGSVAPDAMTAVYEKHDVIVLMSDQEGLPIALLEGMAHGLVPVCLSERSGVDEIVRDGVNGLIAPDKAAGFVAALARLEEDPALFHRLRQESVRTVEDEYSSSLNANHWEALLERLAPVREPKALRIPRAMRLPPAEPRFGSEDLRIPRLFARAFSRAGLFWFRTRQAIRPRSRLRGMMNKMRA